MKRKDIEKAAGDYSGSILGCEGGSVTVKRQSFIDGAEWRINSIWHNAKEEPKYDQYFLYENVVHAYHVDGIYPSEDEPFVWDDYVKDMGLLRWAYVEDLLPIK